MGIQRKIAKTWIIEVKEAYKKNEEEHKTRHKKQEEREHLVLFTTLWIKYLRNVKHEPWKRS